MGLRSASGLDRYGHILGKAREQARVGLREAGDVADGAPVQLGTLQGIHFPHDVVGATGRLPIVKRPPCHVSQCIDRPAIPLGESAHRKTVAS